MLKSKEMKWISANNEAAISNYSDSGISYSDISNSTVYETMNWVEK